MGKLLVRGIEAAPTHDCVAEARSEEVVVARGTVWECSCGRILIVRFYDYSFYGWQFSYASKLRARRLRKKLCK